MKRMLAIAMAAVAVTAVVAADYADARRLGGGRSLGAQRQSVAPAKAPPPAATPAPAQSGAASNPVMPAQSAAATSRAAGAPAAASGASRWLGPVAGLAAGLGLAALAAHLGMSEALMSFLLIMLLAIAGIALLRLFLGRRTQGSQGAMPYAGAGASLGTRASGYGAQTPPATSKSSYEPVFGGGERTEPTLASNTAWSKSTPRRFPPGFDPEPFLRQAGLQFRRLQAAYSARDRVALAEVMTPELFADIAHELDANPAPSVTEVVTLTPEIVDVTTENGKHWASVRFRGLLREDGQSTPIDEMWNLAKPVDGSSGWLLAGIRQIDAAAVGHA